MHSRKTAGSSIAALLNRHLGPRDIQIGAWPEAIAHGGAYNRAAVRAAFSAPRNLITASVRQALKSGRVRLHPEAVNSIIKKMYADRHGLHLAAHETAQHVQGFVPDAWRRYYKFCFVRNPWTHLVSDYYWRMNVRGNPDISFREFVLRLDDPARPDPEKIRPAFISNWEIYTINDEIAVDHVARFENLAEELSDIGAKIGIPLDISSIHAKGGIRNRKKDVAAHFDPELVDIVGRLYAREVQAFGYQPPF